jgi:elongation factor 2
MPEPQSVDPTEGTVAFGSALFGWAFTLNKFARMYSKKVNCPPEVLVKKFWGDNYFDPSVKKWITTDVGSDGKKLKRGFV